MKNPTEKDIKSDVLQSQEHTMLSSQEVAKAVARHKREHPEKKTGGPAKMQKSSPRR